MTFFVPEIESSKTEKVYLSIKEYLENNLGIRLSPKRYYKVSYYEGSEFKSVSVGNELPSNDEIVKAIFYEEARDLFHVCTASNGAYHGYPFQIGSEKLQRNAITFENYS